MKSIEQQSVFAGDKAAVCKLFGGKWWIIFGMRVKRGVNISVMSGDRSSDVFKEGN